MITIPAPSPITNPSRFRSNGRLAPSGFSLFVEIAFMALKPPMPIGVIAASDPPQTIISAPPIFMIWLAVPMACPDVAQADTVAKFGPFRLYSIEICPAAISDIICGIKNGLILLGPCSISFLNSNSKEYIPPIPDPTITPILDLSNVSKLIRALSIASRALTIAYWV